MTWIDLENQLLLPSASAAATITFFPDQSRDTFVRKSLSTASSLQTLGVRHVALWFDDASSLAQALFACWRAGITAVLPGDVGAHTCSHLDAEVDLWLSDRPLPLPDSRQKRLAELPEREPLSPAALDLNAQIVLCTSGSSGVPKRISKQWRQLSREVQALEQQWPALDDKACVLGSVSTQHMYGLPFRVLWPLCAGRPIDRVQRGYPEELQAASLLHTTFIWIASPALLRRLGAQLDWTALRSKLIAIVSSGGPLPGDVSDTLFAQLGLRPTEIYGSSETGAVAWRQGDAAWQCLPGVQVGVNDEQALWVRSGWLEDTQEQTQDAATLMPQGFQLHGRLDRIVKIEEKRISLASVEQTLAGHPYCTETRVGRSTGAARLTALVALSAMGLHVLRNQGRRVLVQTLQHHVSEKFESLAVPRQWRFMRQLPWNSQGKLPQSLFDAVAGPRPKDPIVCGEVQVGEDANSRRITLEIPFDLAHFSGHFPQTPVVPGIAQIGWAVALAKQHLLPRFRVTDMEVLKFQRLLRPGDQVELLLRWDEARGKLYFNYDADGQACSSGRILQAERHEPV